MQFTAILSALSLAMVASALPNPTTPTGPTCDAGGEVACCDSVDNKGVGINCFASSTVHPFIRNCSLADCVLFSLAYS